MILGFLCKYIVIVIRLCRSLLWLKYYCPSLISAEVSKQEQNVFFVDTHLVALKQAFERSGWTHLRVFVCFFCCRIEIEKIIGEMWSAFREWGRFFLWQSFKKPTVERTMTHRSNRCDFSWSVYGWDFSVHLWRMYVISHNVFTLRVRYTTKIWVENDFVISHH